MAARSWDSWGHLADRYRAAGVKRLLALDGGGIRGLLTLQILDKLERDLRLLLDGDASFRLCDYFDVIGGTSTGAIIAAGLARGMSTGELITFYREFGREAFTKRSIFERWKSFYDDGPLQAKLRETFADATLEPEHLRCLLVVVTRNATTDSAWPISSNPWAKYNETSRPDCNLSIPLWRLVRASTAAPVFFPPEVIQVDPKDSSKDFVFVDGGTTSYNNPAFMMYRMVTAPPYHLEWLRGERQMMIVSIGTGSGPVIGQRSDDPERNLASAAKQTLDALMSQAAFDQDLSCRTIGRCVSGLPLDREVGDLIPREDGGALLPLSRDLGRAFLYARYDAELTARGLKALGCGDLDPVAVSALDSVQHMDDLERIGRAVSEHHLDLSAFGDVATAGRRTPR